MSWWTKNREKVLLGLLGGGAVAATAGGAVPALSGLFGGAEAAALPEALAATKGVGQTAAMKGGIDAAIAAEGGSEMGLAGTKAVSDAYFGKAAPVAQKMAGLLSGGPSNPMMAMAGANMMQPPPAPQPPPMMPPPQAPSTPGSNFGGYGDPLANLTPEQKRKLMAMMQQGRTYG